jgi:tRNA pseudouridine-54 N-methylase
MAELPSPAKPWRHFVIPFSRLPVRASLRNLDLVKTRGDVWCRCLIAALMVSRGTRNDASFTAVPLALPPISPNHSLAATHATAGQACESGEIKGAVQGSAIVGAHCATHFVPVYLRACGRHIKCLRPEQSTCAAILNAALPPSSGDVLEMFANGQLNSIDGKRGCCQGLHVGIGGFEQALLDFTDAAMAGPRPLCIVLQENSDSLESILTRMVSDAHAPPSAFVIVLGDHDGLSPEQELSIDAALASRAVPVVRASLGQTELLASQAIVITHYMLDKVLGSSDVSKPAFDPNDEYCDRQRPCCVCCPPSSTPL